MGHVRCVDTDPYQTGITPVVEVVTKLLHLAAAGSFVLPPPAGEL
jgi:hypothetical protein